MGPKQPDPAVSSQMIMRIIAIGHVSLVSKIHFTVFQELRVERSGAGKEASERASKAKNAVCLLIDFMSETTKGALL